MSWVPVYKATNGAVVWRNKLAAPADKPYMVTRPKPDGRLPMPTGRFGEHRGLANAAYEAGVPVDPVTASALTMAEDAARQVVYDNDTYETRTVVDRIVDATICVLQEAER